MAELMNSIRIIPQTSILLQHRSKKFAVHKKTQKKMKITLLNYLNSLSLRRKSSISHYLFTSL